MRFTPWTLVTCIVIGIASVAAVTKVPSRLTIQRVLELTAPTDATAAKNYRVQISSLGQTVITADQLKGRIISSKEVIFPTEFLPSRATRGGEFPYVVPATPTNFEKVDAGWDIRLTAKPVGKLVVIMGVAEYVDTALVPAGYGEISGPIYAGEEVQNPNPIDLPKVQTTTTYFQISALPGKSYDVRFYRGKQVETHRVDLTAE